VKFKWILLVVLAIAAPIGSLFFGAASLSVQDITVCLVEQCSSVVSESIFWDIRFPRVMVGFLVGSALAISGATLQNVTRNSLADPYLFGVVSGAGFGASIASLLFANETFLAAPIPPEVKPFLLPMFAFTGSLLAVLLVRSIASSSLGGRIEHMLLAGIAVSFMLSALTHFLLFIGDPYATNQVIFWLMGSLSRVDTAYMWGLLGIVMICTVVLILLGPRLDALLLGDESAQTLGVNVQQLRMLCLIVCALLTAVVVAYCGGIGFVGLMIPHIVRRWFGVTSRRLMLGCVLLGGIFMVWVDVIARAAVPNQEIPIGIITSAIGSVFFLLAMRKT